MTSQVDRVAVRLEQLRPGSHATRPQKVQRSYWWVLAPTFAVFAVELASRLRSNEAPLLTSVAVVVLYVGTCVLAITPGIALLSVVAHRHPVGPATGLGLLFAGMGGSAMIGFWSWYINPDLGRSLVAAILVGSIVINALYCHRGDLHRLDLATPLTLMLIVGLAYTGLAFIQGGFLGDTWHAVASRYWEDPSNNIPFWFASRVAAHQPLHGYLLSDWLSSDRPPLQAGFTLLIWPLWGSRQPSYQLFSTALQLMWLPAIWVLLRVRGYSSQRILVVCLSTALTGVVFVNSIYVWPKMLAAAFILSAFAILVSDSPADDWSGIGIVIVALVAVGLLAHGGVAFSVIALVPFTYRYWRRMTRRTVLLCLAVSAALYAPWIVFQKFVDPPGDRLLKWQLAGFTGVDSRGVFQTLRQQYGSLSPERLLGNKLDNVTTLIVNPGLLVYQKADPAWHGFLGVARGAQINDLAVSAGPLLLGLIALVMPTARIRLASVRPLLVFLAASLIAWVLLLYGGNQVTTTLDEGSYAATLLFVALLALAVTMLPRFYAGLVLTANLLWFVICWVPGVGFQSAQGGQAGSSGTDVAMLIVLLISMIAIALLCWCEFSRRPRSLTVLQTAEIPGQVPEAFASQRARGEGIVGRR